MTVEERIAAVVRAAGYEARVGFEYVACGPFLSGVTVATYYRMVQVGPGFEGAVWDKYGMGFQGRGWPERIARRAVELLQEARKP